MHLPRSPIRSTAVLAFAAIGLSACGTAPGDGDGVGLPDFEQPSGDGTGDGADGAGGGAGGGGIGASSTGPITLEWGDSTFGYQVGRCEVIDDVVYAQARSDDLRSTFELTLAPWDRENAHALRDGYISASALTNQGGVELVAGRNDPGTTWDWTIDGTDVEVRAVMGDRQTATRNSDGTTTFTELPEVTIRLECAGPFGVGFPDEPTHEEFSLITLGLARAPGTVTIDLDGTVYPIAYLSTCTLFSDDVVAEGASDAASVYLYSEGAGVQLDLLIGDRREAEAGQRWSLPPEASQQRDFAFDGTGSTRTWSGALASQDGASAQATVTVECEGGDAFQAAGMATVLLGGTSYAIDEVTACVIAGTTIDFFGRQRGDGVALIVTDGGSQILFQDPSGLQALTRDVQFDIAGQQATWTGALSGVAEPVTISIDCG